jgi:L-alanine-DL-glutamate epimerase-like enolase superfamily enzyme
MFEVGVHLAAALPGTPWLENSFHNWNFLLEEPVKFEDGYAFAPEIPGHGLRISQQARKQYAQPNIEDLSEIAPHPSPLHLPPR